MFKKGDEVVLTYYEFDEQVESHGWVVEDYDNGLMKVVTHPSALPMEAERKARVFNLRSIGFLKAELVEERPK